MPSPQAQDIGVPAAVTRDGLRTTNDSTQNESPRGGGAFAPPACCVAPRGARVDVCAARGAPRPRARRLAATDAVLGGLAADDARPQIGVLAGDEPVCPWFDECAFHRTQSWSKGPMRCPRVQLPFGSTAAGRC